MKNHPQSTGQNYLMAIAIEEYAHFPNAPMAVQKVENLVKTLQAKYRFTSEHTSILSNEQATLENIFQELESLINKLGAEDRLLLVFSGWSDSKKLFNQSYWIPANAQEGKTHQYLATSELISTLQSFKSKQILVLSDATFFPIFYEPFNQETSYPDTTNGTTAHWLLASGASIQDGTFQESTFIDQFNKTLLENPGEYLINEVVNKMKEGLSEAQSSQLIFGHLKGVAIDKVALFKLNPQLNEAAEWAICKQENDLLAYNLFLQKYPNGTYAEEARQQLVSFQEDIDWEEALSANTVDAYLNYKKKYRNGKFSSEADEKMAMASIASFGQQETPSEAPESNKPTAPKDNPNQPSDYTRTPTRLSPKSFVTPKKTGPDVLPKKKEEKKNSLIPILAVAMVAIAGLGLFFKYGGSKKPVVPQEITQVDTPSNNKPEGEKKNIPSTVPDVPEENNSTEIPIDHTLTEDPKTEDPIEELPPTEEVPTPPVDGLSVADMMRKGQNAFDQKKYSEAIGFYTQVIRQEPGNSRAASQLKESRAFQQDIETYQQRIKEGNTLFGQKKYKEAIGLFQRSLKYQPGDTYALEKIKETEALLKAADACAGLSPAVCQQEQNMILIRGGSFTIGSNAGEGDEQPETQISVNSFRMSQYEVTQELYYEVTGQKPSGKDCPKCPVENVSWNDANEFIKKLNQITKKGYRLPSEVEWEYAAKGGNSPHQQSYAGSSSLNSVAWHSGNAQNRTQQVKQKSPTPQGIYDLTGNVSEWCYDWYREQAYGAATSTPTPSRVIRGGSYLDDAADCRVTNRQSLGPRFQKAYIGFRLVR